MMRRLQRRFIRIAVIALTVAMVLVVGIVNLFNWISVRNEWQETLSFIAQNGGVPEPDRIDSEPGRGAENDRMKGKDRHTRNLISESGWFSVSYNENGTQRSVNVSSMNEADEETATELAGLALESSAVTGFLQDYLYQVQENPNGGKTLFFLDCETKLTAVRTLALISGLACLGGIALAFLIVALASKKAVEPTIRNIERQKQFITNAGHELKTPLTVISTNMELLQMETEENQWIRSTQKQTTLLRRLVDELVYLSRMEEEDASLSMENLNLTALIREAAEPFSAMAGFNGLQLDLVPEDDLCVTGDRASIQRLVSILCDNAVKYAAENGKIVVSARTEGRNAVLTVANEVTEPLSKEQCDRLFDRFYRADPSRSKTKQSGFGIGLSIAAAIAEKHGGSISAAMQPDGMLGITCRLPKGNKGS